MGVLGRLGTDILPWLGLLLGDVSAVRRWFVHLVTSGLFGLVFAVFVSLRFFEELASSLAGRTILDVAHGMVLSFVTVGVALPLVTDVLVVRPAAGGEVLTPTATGFGTSVVFGLAHLVHGVVLGVRSGIFHESPEEGRGSPRGTPRPFSTRLPHVPLCRRTTGRRGSTRRCRTSGSSIRRSTGSSR